MRTFPKSLASFRKIVEERGQALRKLSYDQLKLLRDSPTERLRVESRPATIGIIVESQEGGALRVVVQGFMKSRLIPFGSNVALDGFYMQSDGTIAEMASDEFYDFG